MDDIREGFISHALEAGLSDNQAAQLWKSAQEYPGTEEVFKRLGVPTKPAAEASTPADEAMLAKLEEQKKVHDELTAIKQQLGI